MKWVLGTYIMIIFLRTSRIVIAVQSKSWICKAYRGEKYMQSSDGEKIRSTVLITESRLAMGPTQPPIQWVPGALSLGVK
jgi:hypothetical protein